MSTHPTVNNQPTETPSRNSEQPPFDFITGYADYADVFEAPRLLHESVAIQIVASALNRNKVSIPHGPIHYSLDLWMLLLSTSGLGRGTVLHMSTPVLQNTPLQDLETPVQWGSSISVYQQLAENPHAFFYWGEFSERLNQLNNPRFASVKQWITDRYDNFKTPANIKYRVTGKSSDTPPICFTDLPRINILATSSEEWFFANLVTTDSTGGFLPRYLLVRVGDEQRDVAIPKETDSSLIPVMETKLREIGKLKGRADVSAIRPLYQEWYSATKRRFQSQPNRLLADAFFRRHRGHVLKLAVIFEASETATLVVSERAWKRAVEFASRIEQCIFSLLSTGMSAQGYAVQQVEQRILKAGREGLSQNELTRAFQHLKLREREEFIKTLTGMDRIRSNTQSSGGRYKTVYVHEKYFRQGVA